MNVMLSSAAIVAACAATWMLPVAAMAQDTSAARDQGKAFGNAVLPAAQNAATTAPDATRVPNFNNGAAQSGYFDNPDRIAGDSQAAASSNEAYTTVRSSIANRPRVNPQFVAETVTRSKAIAADPLSYTSGMNAGGAQGRCVPLPPASGSPGRYQATCNVGYKLDAGVQSCTIPLVVNANTVTDTLYYCTDGGVQRQGDCASLQVPECWHTGTHPGKCLQGGIGPGGNSYCTEPGEPIEEYTCTTTVPGFTAISVTKRQVVNTNRDESQCASLAADSGCTAPNETCTDSDPFTRTVNGIAMTRPCWAWRRDYQCTHQTAAQDCTTLDATPGCRLLREDCLTEDVPCKSVERVYDCPLPPEPGAAQQFICDGDVSCIDGACETVTREANTEFKDAVVALNAMDQATKEFDPDNLTLFKGERNTCSSQVFGIINCCKGKGFPLIPGIGLLVALGCSSEELQLHQRDAKGLCAYVGSYCSSSFLGICLTKQKAYCCFQSKLSRILQEQGRAQLPKPWAKPKTEQCLGFTLDEFARLDLSKMDFSVVYAEFTAAAKLPDDLTTAAELQQKIEDYYAAHKP
jgi:conjugal transfer mating pair stabilization protein TraN